MPVMTILTSEIALRKRSLPVELAATVHIPNLLGNMVETMLAAGGIGLAAPQVGVHFRIIVALDRAQHRLLKLINPVTREAEGTVMVIEGCLSIPGKRGRVARSERVTVAATDAATGEAVTIKAEGELAAILQHEIDHLDGRLFTDHAVEVWESATGGESA